MADIMRGSDIPFILRNLPEGAEIKRLDFSQLGRIVITKTSEDFTYNGNDAQSLLSQKDTLRFNATYTIEIQLSYVLNGHAKRTRIATAMPDKILYEGVI
jgi:hypothetical protein